MLINFKLPWNGPKETVSIISLPTSQVLSTLDTGTSLMPFLRRNFGLQHKKHHGRSNGTGKKYWKINKWHTKWYNIPMCTKRMVIKWISEAFFGAYQTNIWYIRIYLFRNLTKQTRLASISLFLNLHQKKQKTPCTKLQESWNHAWDSHGWCRLSRPSCHNEKRGLLTPWGNRRSSVDLLDHHPRDKANT